MDKEAVRRTMVMRVSDIFGRLFIMQEGFTPDQAKEYMKKRHTEEFFDEDVVKDFFNNCILTKDMVTCLIKHDEGGRLENSQEGILKVCIFETRRRTHAFVSTANGAGYAGDHFRRVPENWDDPLALKNRKLGHFMLKDAWIKKVKDHFGAHDFYDRWLAESKKIIKTNKAVIGLEAYELWLQQFNKRGTASIGTTILVAPIVIKKTLSVTINPSRILLDLKPILLQFAENGILDVNKLEIRHVPIGLVELRYNG